MTDESEDSHETSYWPSVSDLFLTCFILALAVLAAAWYSMKSTSNVNYKQVVDIVGGVELLRIREPINRMRSELGTLPPLKAKDEPEKVVAGLSITADEVVDRFRKQNAEIAELRKRIGTLEVDLDGEKRAKDAFEKLLNDKPPIIKIAEAGKDGNEKYRFNLGSAVLTKAFKDGLREGGFKDLADEISKRNKPGRVSVDTLEVIGHTDGKPISRHGNLDEMLPMVLSGRLQEFSSLAPGSNNDLGLLRALAIKEAWKEYVQARADKDSLEKIEVRCYSAGQTVPDGVQSTDAELRDPGFFKKENTGFRRIEIRLTKLK